ncbi:hypothetical protein RSA36_19865 [Pantoea stewartii]|uniref:Uncharacterized protein n=1 Tax=Pantoea stewartii TaxID=66269 RepID=A0AB34VCK2_9GAMM|nr:hypothetical protein RSA13_18675 [Pantoea stewartii]KTT05654.1 hypothetical protein RSA36_19865 [Pantoea stewartii]
MRIQSLRPGFSALCRFVTTRTFETQGQPLLAVESKDVFMVTPPAFKPEHDVNSAVAMVYPGFADLPDAQA